MSDPIATSSLITRISWGILWQNRMLLLFPLISMILTGYILTELFVTQLWRTMIGSPHILMLSVKSPFIEPSAGPAVVIALFWILICCGVIGFFTAALVAAFSPMLAGDAPSARSGITRAARHLPDILIWSVAWGIMRFLLYAGDLFLRNIFYSSLKILGDWRTAAEYVIPIMVIENQGLAYAWKQSLDCSRRTVPDRRYNRFMINNPGISDARFSILVWSVIIAVLVLPLVYLGLTMMYITGFDLTAFSALVLPVIVILVLALVTGYVVITSALTGILSAARYWYIKTGAVTPLFPKEIITGWFQDDIPTRNLEGTTKS
jgi:uncharacterized integral membrane protein